MGKVTDKRIAAIRKRMAKDVRGDGPLFGSLAPALEEALQKAAQYSDFRKIENERQLEMIKAALDPYMYNESVRVEGAVIVKGEVKVIVLDRFETMLKAMSVYLAAMNMQNKMWGIYDSTKTDGKGLPPQDARAVALNTIQELQRLAKRASLPLANAKAKVLENGS